jgi:hypothetical protein
MFCAPGLISRVTERVRSSFHVLRSRTRFRLYRGRRLPFSCLALSDSFFAVPWLSAPVFLFCAPELIFNGAEGVGSRYHILRSRTRFRRCGGRRVPFSGFALPESFSAILRATYPIFYCTEVVGSRFHILCSRTHFTWYRGRWLSFSCFALLTHFRRYRGRRVQFSCFALPDKFSAVLTASGPVFMFCAPGHVFGDAEVVWSRFHVLRSRTYFRRFRGRRVPFSFFARSYLFSAVRKASSPVFMFCALGLVFDGNECVCS